MTRKDDPESRPEDAVQPDIDVQSVQKYDPDEPVTLHAGVEIMIGGLARLPSSTKRWIRFWKSRN